MNNYAALLPDPAEKKLVSILNLKTENATGKHDSWFGADKFDHFFLSAFMTGLSYGTLHNNLNRPASESLMLSGSFSFGLGISKEAYDRRSGKGHPSFKDLVADALGVACALLLIKIF